MFSVNICYLFFSRPGQSQGLLYKQPFNHSLSEPFPPTALLRRHAQTVRVSTSSYNTDYVIVIKNLLNPKGHHNCISGSKVTAILLKGLFFPIGGNSSVEGLQSMGLPRLVLHLTRLFQDELTKDSLNHCVDMR